MKIPGAHLQMLNNQCTNFQKNPCTHFSEHAWTNSYSQTVDTQTDGRTDRRTDRQTVRQTDGQGETNIPPKLSNNCCNQNSCIFLKVKTV